jgi:SAM-dependent methyltransferase
MDRIPRSLALLAGVAAGAALALSAGAQAPADAPAPGEGARKPDVHWVPTPEDVVKAMLDAAAVRPGDVVYDLGCGDGRIVIAAAKRGAGKGVCVDIDPERVADARAAVRKAKVGDRVKVVQGDLFEQDFRDADVVALYLLPSLNLKLRPKLLEELRPGARVVSHAFDMGDWPPERKLDVGGRTVYLWTVPPREGRAVGSGAEGR